MKLTFQLYQNFTDEDLEYVRQLGIRHVVVGTTGGTRDFFQAAKKRVESAGLELTNIGNTDVHNMPAVTLGLPERDAMIGRYIEYLHDLHAIGMSYTTYAHMANGLWSSPNTAGRGNSVARTFNADTATGRWLDQSFAAGNVHGRAYSEEELWENFAYFTERVVPVAEELGINIGLHPDDPPGLTLGGVPRCIASSYQGYQKAFEIADSPNFGACLCIGSWLEGGSSTGATPEEAIRGFAAAGKLWKVHFRNVSAPVPVFRETFLDEGYGSMVKYMATLAEVNFDGILIADHVPGMVGDPRNPWSLSIGYIQGMMDALGIERA
ncbi:mannonate dehydratase [Arthrobacter sp. AG258]|uniref:mannonate dehydratase n=1 Tax=Arthrobacter sp. AG258 TaxID=2183899 RepID=UPI001060A77C|nr:mannonate dehydratase [Arthrobacter sp. AG258]TDT74673.1 mannonate dehydratase [Arthrobacter sp. AG258]